MIVDDRLREDDADDWSISGGILSVHVERMDAGRVWMAIYLVDGSRYVVHVETPRNGKVFWRVEEDW